MYFYVVCIPHCRYFENKEVYHRYKTSREQSSYLDSRDYDPDEERTINLNDEHWSDQWYLVCASR